MVRSRGPTTRDPLTCTYAEEIQNFANWFTYYRSREYTAKAALGRTVSDVTNIRLGYVVLNDTNERLSIASMNASYRVGNKKAMMNQIYKVDSNNGTPLRAALDKAGKYFECRAGGSFGSPNTVARRRTVPGIAVAAKVSARTTSRCCSRTVRGTSRLQRCVERKCLQEQRR